MKHEVSLNINDKLVLHKDVEVEVWNDDGKLGTLLISKGNIEWKPSPKTVNVRRLTWEKFDELMQAEGKPVKKPTKKKSAKSTPAT